MRRRSLITAALIEETPLEKKKADAEKERLKKEATKKAEKAAQKKVDAQARGAKTGDTAPATAAPPPAGPAGPAGGDEAPMGPPPKPIKIPKLPPEDLPRSEKPIKKRSPKQRHKDIHKAMEDRRKYLQNMVRDFYGVMGLAGGKGNAGPSAGSR